MSSYGSSSCRPLIWKPLIFTGTSPLDTQPLVRKTQRKRRRFLTIERIPRDSCFRKATTFRTLLKGSASSGERGREKGRERRVHNHQLTFSFITLARGDLPGRNTSAGQTSERRRVNLVSSTPKSSRADVSFRGRELQQCLLATSSSSLPYSSSRPRTSSRPAAPEGRRVGLGRRARWRK